MISYFSFPKHRIINMRRDQRNKQTEKEGNTTAKYCFLLCKNLQTIFLKSTFRDPHCRENHIFMKALHEAELGGLFGVIKH